MFIELSLPESFHPLPFTLIAHYDRWKETDAKGHQGREEALTLPLGVNLFSKLYTRQGISTGNNQHNRPWTRGNHQPRNRASPKPSDIVCFCFHSSAWKLAITQQIRHCQQWCFLLYSFPNTHTLCRGVCEKLQFTAVICFEETKAVVSGSVNYCSSVARPNTRIHTHTQAYMCW